MAQPPPPLPRHVRRHHLAGTPPAPGPRPRHKAPPFAVRGKRRSGFSALPFVAGPIGAIVTFAGAVVLALVAVVGVVAVGAGAAFGYFTSDLPQFDPNKLPQFETSRIYDRYGNLLEEISDPTAGNRYEVPLSQVSPFLINATIAAEDRTFLTNRGVDVQAIGRAVRNTFIDTSYGSSGGSTITMQVIKQAFPQRYDNPSREDKVRQVVAAYALSEKYSKDEVMTFYLNNVFYGNRSYGIQAAAQNYFHTDAKNLELWQASILAGLGQAPSRYDPTANLERARTRQRYVLSQMVEQGFISQVQADDAVIKSADPKKYFKFKDAVPAGAPHFVNYVHQYMEQYGDAFFRGGLKIYTTIDLDVQRLAEDVVRTGVQREGRAGYDVSNGALVAVVPWSGQILCMVGSTDFYDQSKTKDGFNVSGEFNVATNPRQPGSSIKPIAYAAAIQRGWYPSYMILDYHKTWDDGSKEGYTPNNFNKLHNGAVSVREALQQSLNIPALKAIEYVGTDANGVYRGVQPFIDFAHKIGLKSSFNRPADEYGLGISLALGGGEVSVLELTNAYGTFLNNGRYVPASPIIRIETTDGKVFVDPRTGKLVDNSTTVPKGEKVLEEGEAYLMTSILTDNRARTPIFGASSPLILRDRPVAAKTGTTNDFRDGWTVGYSSQLSVGVWVGNNDNHAMKDVDGVETAAPIWNEFMRLIHDYEKAPDLLRGPDGKLPAKEFYRPPTVIDGVTCTATGHAAQYNSGTKDVFVMGREPKLKCGELGPYERASLVEAWADFTKDNALIARQGGTGVPQMPTTNTNRKIEYGRYTSTGSSRLTQYYSAVDQQFRPKGARSPVVATAAPVVVEVPTAAAAPLLTQAAMPAAPVAPPPMPQPMPTPVPQPMPMAPPPRPLPPTPVINPQAPVRTGVAR